MSITKTYIDANRLLADAFALGLDILESGYQPDCVVGIWRGGAPVAIAVHEVMRYCGVHPDHIAIRTSHYTGIARTAASVDVDGLEYLAARRGEFRRLLLVDDVFDTGRSIEQVMRELEHLSGADASPPVVKIATPYFKPANNRTSLTPDFYLHETADWLVFPHELEGLDAGEVLESKPLPAELRERIARGARSG